MGQILKISIQMKLPSSTFLWNYAVYYTVQGGSNFLVCG